MGGGWLVMSPSLARCCAPVDRWLRHLASASNRAQPFRPQHRGVPMSISTIVGRAARFLGTFAISVGCLLATSADALANAQDAGESVCGPITTKRLERLARVYLALNADGAFAPALASSTVFVDLVDTLVRDRSTARNAPPRRSANGGVSSAEGRCPCSRRRRGLSWHDFA